ncbi:hypothetical protein GCM10011571_16890 [Marinithermofilum abyssi]|uniref:Mg chelatase-related protein C-terminal domain-containing protein n=1 Tax=Marinithermofilum abyssi TaxID=1571185 RepID=A0A8J2VGD3_9BACL|nr:ATP-binding protein [Marinithermofilum abyssi]GGE15884.1 hypothetical protein GCM10011571_16890 [Marinithermofilum abyssi]
MDYKTLSAHSVNESSRSVRERVNVARRIQEARFAGTDIWNNASMSSLMIRKYCELDKDSRDLLKQSFDTLGLSARAHDRILKLSRTIADLAGEKRIQLAHVAEAIQYRTLDRKWWG